MNLLVHHAGEVVKISLQQDESAQAGDLAAAIERTLDIPVHKQKLIFKGKVVDAAKPLSCYGIKEGSKIMLLASATDAKVQHNSRKKAEDRRQQALHRKERRDEKVAAKAEAEQQSKRPLSPASQASRTRTRWQASGIVSLRGLELTELPDLQLDWAALGPATMRLYAVDVGNNLLVSLPDVFLSLQELRKFRCSHNLLCSDTLPWTTLSLLPKLTHLFLDHNCLACMNPVLCQAGTLCTLSLSNNKITELPDEMNLLKALEQLDISHNQLVSLPPSLGQCGRLRWLDGRSNRVSAVPDTFSAMSLLRGLLLDDNGISALPDGLLEQCSSLHTISVLENPITMQQVREGPGFEAFARRRKNKLDKIIDSHIAADFTEAADYEQFHRH